MDLSYFESAIPVMGDILDVIIASGWALLLGNLVFQAAKSMMSGLGFEGEDPKTLFARTFVFGFLLLASRQICDIGLGISSTVITMLQVPSSISVSIPGENVFSISASWLLVIIVGFVLMWQIVKLFFEIGERYFLVGFLTLTAPWAFAMGGSKSTADIFKGWARMYASMCLMMVLNVVFLKMLLSAMGNMPSDAGVLAWMIFVVAIARVARKIDNVIARIGLNPAFTGDGLGRSFPGMLSYMVVRTVASSIIKTAGAAGKSKTPSGGSPPPSGASSAATRHNPFSRNNPGNRGAAQNTTHTQDTSNSTPQQAGTDAAGTAQANTGPQSVAAASGAAGTKPSGSAGLSQAASAPGAAGTAGANANQGQSGHQFHADGRNTAGQQAPPAQRDSARRSSVTKASNARSPVFHSGAAGTPGSMSGQNASTIHPPIPRSGQASQASATGATGPAPQGESKTPRPARYSAVPPGSRSIGKPGAAGTANQSGGTSSTRTQQGGVNINAQNQSHISADQATSQHEFYATSNRGPSAPQKSNMDPTAPGAAGTGSRRSSVSTDKPPGAAGSAPTVPKSPASAASTGTAGTESRRSTAPSASPAGHATAQTPRSGGQRDAAPNSRLRAEDVGFTSSTGSARRESDSKNAGDPRVMRPPSPGAAGTAANTTKSAKNTGAQQSRQSVIGQGATRINGINVPKKSKGGKKQNRKGKGDT